MKQLLDKRTFMQIKKYGYGEMSAFLNALYRQAYDDGQKEGLTPREVREALLSVKGVGEKTADKIMEALSVRWEEEDGQKYECGNCHSDITRYKDTPFCPFCGAELYRE